MRTLVETAVGAKLKRLWRTIVFLLPAAAFAAPPMKYPILAILAAGIGGIATLSGDGSAIVTTTSPSSLFVPAHGGHLASALLKIDASRNGTDIESFDSAFARREKIAVIHHRVTIGYDDQSFPGVGACNDGATVEGVHIPGDRFLNITGAEISSKSAMPPRMMLRFFDGAGPTGCLFIVVLLLWFCG